MARCQPLRPEAWRSTTRAASRSTAAPTSRTRAATASVCEDGLVRVRRLGPAAPTTAQGRGQLRAPVASPSTSTATSTSPTAATTAYARSRRKVRSTWKRGVRPARRRGGKASFNSPCGVATTRWPANPALRHRLQQQHRARAAPPPVARLASTLATACSTPYGIACDAMVDAHVRGVPQVDNLVRLVACRGRPTVLAGCGKPGISGVQPPSTGPTAARWA